MRSVLRDEEWPTGFCEDCLEPHEEFKTLIEALKGFQINLLDSGHKILGFMVIVLGWVIASDGTRDFLVKHLVVRDSFIAFLGLAVVGYSFMVCRVYGMSRSVFLQLVRLDYAKREVYEHYAIKRIVPIYYTVFHLLISALICVVVTGSN